MAKLEFDAVGKHYYETGVSKGVLFVKADANELGAVNGYREGVAWNGLTAVTESPEGAEETVLYADNIKYLSLRSAEDFKATIEAYTYPDEFGECDGSNEVASGVKIAQQKRRSFAFCYRTEKSNDEGIEGYILHIIYGCTVSPSEKAYATINESPEAITFSWELSSVPIKVQGVHITDEKLKPTAHVEIDSTVVGDTIMAKIEEELYGTDDVTPEVGDVIPGKKPHLLTPDDIVGIVTANTVKKAVAKSSSK